MVDELRRTLKRNAADVLADVFEFATDNGHSPSRSSIDANEKRLATQLDHYRRRAFSQEQKYEIEAFRNSLKHTPWELLMDMEEHVRMYGYLPRRTGGGEPETKLAGRIKNAAQRSFTVEQLGKMEAVRETVRAHELGCRAQAYLAFVQTEARVPRATKSTKEAQNGLWPVSSRAMWRNYQSKTV